MIFVCPLKFCISSVFYFLLGPLHVSPKRNWPIEFNSLRTGSRPQHGSTFFGEGQKLAWVALTYVKMLYFYICTFLRSDFSGGVI